MKKPVHIFLILVTFAIAGASCKKLVEDKRRDLLVQAMTAGLWHVETYQEGSTTITDEFAGYNFQFFENGTVTGVKDSKVQDGTWVGDLQNLSITSDFPSAGNPLNKLNGTWKIIDSAPDYVAAEMSTPNGKAILHLRKNQ